jgi:hypothetical protein
MLAFLLRRTLGIFGQAMAAIFVSAREIYKKDPGFFEAILQLIAVAKAMNATNQEKWDAVKAGMNLRAAKTGVDIHSVLFNAIIEILLWFLL